jgi:hypothetical protein
MTLQFRYLPGLIPTLLVYYIILLVVFGLNKYYCCRFCLKTCYGAESRNSAIAARWKFKFDDSYESFNPALKYVLLATRFLSFGYILSGSVIANYVVKGGFKWFFFTLWNVELLSIYYLLALACSVIGIFYKPRNVSSEDVFDVESTWSIHTYRLGRITHVLFEVCGGTAVLVTVVNFTVINSGFSFWNATSHFVPLLTLVIELCLNNMYLRVDHYVFNISWAWLYLIFVWPLVVMRRINFWPYPFLALDTPSCYLLYTLLILLDIAFYFIFYGLSTAKFFLRQRQEKIPEEKKEPSLVLPGFSGLEIFKSEDSV